MTTAALIAGLILLGGAIVGWLEWRVPPEYLRDTRERRAMHIDHDMRVVR